MLLTPNRRDIKLSQSVLTIFILWTHHQSEILTSFILEWWLLQLRKPSDPGYEEFWVDFNIGSERITLFCEQDSLLSQVVLLHTLIYFILSYNSEYLLVIPTFRTGPLQSLPAAPVSAGNRAGATFAKASKRDQQFTYIPTCFVWLLYSTWCAFPDKSLWCYMTCVVLVCHKSQQNRTGLKTWFSWIQSCNFVVCLDVIWYYYFFYIEIGVL